MTPVLVLALTSGYTCPPNETEQGSRHVTPQRIGIIGGGAKAAALCAKAACLRDLFGLPVEITVFEQTRLGAAWSGGHGYTDGQQQLCTPAERDAGFPYSLDTFGLEVAREMHSRFSWSAFAVASGLMADWVDRGRPRPTHAEFSGYFAFCVEASGAQVVYGAVDHLAVDVSRWSIGFTGRDDGVPHLASGFDAIVVTSAGPASARLNKVEDPRVLDSVSFWRALGAIPAMKASATEPIVVIGSGGTAAAVAGWLARHRIDTSIVILGDQAALYARSDSVFENRAFRNTDIWTSLSEDDRRAFTDRLTRGAVWSNVLETLAQVPHLEYRPGRALAVRHEPPGDPTGELMVDFSTSSEPKTIRGQPAGLVVDATGFDAWWFATLLPDSIRDEVLGEKARLRKGMSGNLALPLLGAPPLHVPGLSQAISPAFTSLMALGDLSDAILRPYVQAALA